MPDKPVPLESLVELLHSLHRVESNVLLKLVAERLAHDTGTSLHSMLGLLSLLAEEPAGDDRRSRMQAQIRRECSRLEDKIADILAFLRTAHEDKSLFDPAAAIRSFLQIVRPFFMSLRLRVDTDRMEDGTHLEGYRLAFQDLLWKILNETTGWERHRPRQAATVTVSWAGAGEGDGELSLDLANLKVSSNFLDFFQSDAFQRGKLLQYYPTSWMVISTLLQQFQGRFSAGSPSGGAVRLQLIFPRKGSVHDK
ncbi:MAG: HAMP domain-containing histidine kinase [Acidobacteria bacterium]|nr:HAMP domain-containing histidine kinase [Acidobacteriota bacterium]